MARGYFNTSRRVQPTRVPASRADQVQIRTLSRIQNINLLENNPNGGVRQFGQQSILLNDFQGSESIQNMYEQYRFTNVQMFMRPALKGIANNNRLAALSHAAANYTSVQSFVDYDTTSPPTSQEVEGRSDLKSLMLPGGAWTKVASFRPKLLINGGSHQFADNTYWISTNFPSAYNIGLRYLIENGCNGFSTTTGTRAQVQVLIRARIATKGLKTLYSSALVAPPANPPGLGTELTFPAANFPASTVTNARFLKQSGISEVQTEIVENDALRRPALDESEDDSTV